MLLNYGAGEDSWESLGLQKDQTINPKGNQPWILIGRTDAEAELQYFDHLMWRANSLEKTLTEAWKDWRQKEKGEVEDEMVR